MHICIFWVGDGAFVSFGLRQRKKTLLKGMWERDKLEKKRTRGREKKKRDNFTNTPQTLPTFADTPLIFKNSHLPPLNFQKFSLTPLRTN
jgi:hypothetical protein